ncbi:hypothetical protein [Variovorax sp. JS1663]|nr:hypothetical protein [Variovorax sp. JS1663]
MLALPHDEVQDRAQVWEYTVLAANASYDIAVIGQLSTVIAATARTAWTS